MSTFKTNISKKQLDSIIAALALDPNPQIKALKAGEVSAAYELEFPNYSLILRINKHSDSGFWKDLYAYNNFTQYGISIPRIIKNSRKGQFYYSLSEKCPGKQLDSFNNEEGRVMEYDLFAQLAMLHAIPPMGKGYGVWGKNLQAKKAGSINNLHYVIGDRDIKKIIKPFTKLDIHKKLQNIALDLETYLPKERYLIHADSGFNNSFGDGRHITGLIDWAESSYGDFLYDIAWLMFWNKNALETDENFLKFAGLKPGFYNTDHFKERINCYIITIGFGSLSFFTRSDQAKPYQDTIDILKHFKIL